MSSARQILKNIFSLTAAEIFSRGLSVIYSFYLARTLSVEGFGIFGSSKNFTLFFMLFASLGIDAIGTREIAKNRSQINRIVNNIFTIRFLTSILVFIMLCFVVMFIEKSLTEKIVILIFGFNILANNTLLNWVYQGLEQLNVFAIRSIVTNVLNFIGIVLLVHTPDDLILAASVISLSLILNTLWLLIYYIREFGLIKFEFDFNLWKEYLRQGIPIGITFLIIGIYNFQGVVLLNFFSSSYAAGLYNAAYNVLYVTTIISTILQQVYYPIFSRNNSFENREKVFLDFSKLTFLVGTFLPLFLYVFADKVIFFFGKDFTESMTSIRILMIAALFIYFSITIFSPLLAWNFEKKVVYANLTGLLINLTANYFLIPKYAEVGTSISALLSEIAVFIVLCIIFYPIFKKLYFEKYLTYLFLAFISTIPFIYIRFEGYYNLILMFSSFLVFLGLNLAFKTIQIRELKKIITKNEI